MIARVDDHPADELLVELALYGEGPETEQHCSACPSCSRYVKEVRDLKRIIEELPREEVPSGLRDKILRGTHTMSGRRPWYAFDVLHLLRSPFAVGLALVLFVLFLYFFFIHIL